MSRQPSALNLSHHELPERPRAEADDLVAPVGAYFDVEDHDEKTAPNASPIGTWLDPVLVEGALREIKACRTFTRAGYHAIARVHARDAIQKLLAAIAISDRAELIEELVSDREPLASGERDVRPVEAP